MCEKLNVLSCKAFTATLTAYFPSNFILIAAVEMRPPEPDMFLIYELCAF